MSEQQLKYKIGITLIAGIGSVLAKTLISYTGSAEAVFKENKRNLMKIPSIGEHLATEIVSQNILSKAEEEIDFINKNQIETAFYLDTNYPERLKNCNDSPIMLFTKGIAELNTAKVLSIVGTRNITEYGKDLCNNFVAELSKRHPETLIISGLAYGVDVCAHKAAMKHNLATAAVFAHGLDTVYPSLHKNVATEIQTKGKLVTEFLSKTVLIRQNFLRRNRIIAGLADATIIVESGIKGGALVTADIANSYNRDVFAFPGRIGDMYSGGTNRLIKTHKAALIENVDDLEYILNWKTDKNAEPIQTSLFVNLTDEEFLITELLKEHKELNIDIISQMLSMPLSRISYLLLNLEFAGIIRSLPGKTYKLLKNTL